MTSRPKDASFATDRVGLLKALDLLQEPGRGEAEKLPGALPDRGLGEDAVLQMLAPIVLAGARKLGAPTAFAHMDPPTPWITWAMALWTASLNQNLLHPDVAPVARDLEANVIDWLAPEFGMTGGHMTPGSSVSNITAIWAAREITGATRVVSSAAAHLSVAKAANLLGMSYDVVPVTKNGRLDASCMHDVSDAVLVLTAGTTNTGAIDPLDLPGQAAWTHVDAAWCGPMRMSDQYRDRLDGIENADSIAISAHKWLFQPKESALIFFRDGSVAQDAITFGGSYLAAPNVGLLGSHGATAVPLLATLLALGRTGIGARIDAAMAAVDQVTEHLQRMGAEIHPASSNGVLLWRLPNRSVGDLFLALPQGSASKTSLDGVEWVRHVAANPNFDSGAFCEILGTALNS